MLDARDDVGKLAPKQRGVGDRVPPALSQSPGERLRQRERASLDGRQDRCVDAVLDCCLDETFRPPNVDPLVASHRGGQRAGLVRIGQRKRAAAQHA